MITAMALLFSSSSKHPIPLTRWTTRDQAQVTSPAATGWKDHTVINLSAVRLLPWLWALCLMTAFLRGNAAEEEPVETAGRGRRHEVVSIGSDAVVSTNESVSVVTVINGNAQVDGEVRNEVVVIGGNLKVTGRIRGSVVVILGSLEASPTAILNRPAVVVGGTIQQETGARLRSDNHIISPGNSPVLGGLFDWVLQGALWMRPLPPRVLWVWTVPATFFLLYAFMALVLPGPASASVRALSDRPIVSYLLGLVGLVLLLLISPVLLLLGAVGAGLFLIAALLMALLFGRMVIVQFIGLQVTRQIQIPSLHHPLMGLLVGSLIFCLLYTIPVAGFLVWFGTFPLALGGLIVATGRALRPRRVAPEASLSAKAPDAAATGALPGAVANQDPAPAVRRRPVGFFMRLMATLIDLLLIGLLNHLLHIQGRAWLLVWMGYHIALWTWTGSTLGNRVIGMKLSGPSGGPVDYKVAITRCLAAFLSALPLGLGFLWTAWDSRKQSWHDKLTGTRMEWTRP